MSVNPTPSSVDWTSPLKKGSRAERPLHPPSRVARRLFAEFDEVGTQQSTKKDPREQLKKLYGFDFYNPPPSANIQQHREIGCQLLSLECNLDGHQSGDAIRAFIRSRLIGKDHDHIMAELGMVLFYLTSSNSFPQAVLLVPFRAEQMRENMDAYLDSHRRVCGNPLVPSGKTQYLLRAFAHMVVTNNHTYNTGGLYAIRQLLACPEYKLSNYLEHEHRAHILTIVDKVLAQKEFAGLFQRDFTVHPTLQEAVRLDLKLSHDEAVQPVHVAWDCLMALFSDIRQLNAPNCYAVSALIYATENHPYQYVSKLIALLERGHVTVPGGGIAPIWPLLEHRLVHSSDLEFTLGANRCLRLPALKHIAEVLGLRHGKGDLNESMSLDDVLSSLVGGADAAGQLDFARKLYYSFKYNTLAHLMLAVSEFVYVNGSDSSEQGSMSIKEKFVNILLQKIERGLRGLSRQSFQALHDQIHACLTNKLWLVNCKSKPVKRTRHTLSLPEQEVRGPLETLAQLEEVLEVSQRLFKLEGRTLEPVSTFGALQTAVLDACRAIRHSGECSSLPISRISESIFSKSFRVALSNYCSDQIGIKQISGRFLNRSDLLLFSQREGGHEDKVLDLVYGLPVSSQQIRGCSTPYQFLERLLGKLDQFEGSFARSPKVLIATPGNHAWTLVPDCWSLLIDNQSNFYAFIEQSIFRPAKRRMSRPIPMDTMQRIIERYTDDPELQALIRKHFSLLGKPSYGRFKVDFLDRVRPENLDRLEDIIEEEYSKVKLTKNQLCRVFKSLKVSVSTSFFREIHRAVSLEPALPHQIARRVREMLITSGLRILSPYNAEKAVCQAAGLPLPIEVGDLNWVDVYREDPYHLHLMIKYCWIKGVPCYFVRNREKDILQSNEIFQSFIIHHPQIIARTPVW